MTVIVLCNRMYAYDNNFAMCAVLPTITVFGSEAGDQNCTEQITIQHQVQYWYAGDGFTDEAKQHPTPSENKSVATS